MAKKQFKAESKRLLDMMINSIYTHQEIFLRELISNASDAIDKLAYLSLTDQNVGMSRSDFEIRITPDEGKGVLTISDNGIGMTQKELEENLGTIARSGSFQFKKEAGDTGDIDIIGQFGVGFYSAFMVAEAVTVISRCYGEEQAFMWQSSGADGYSITPCEKDCVGTDVIIKLKADTGEETYSQFLKTHELKHLIKKYSDYIRYPIRMEVERQELVPPKEGEEKQKPEYQTVREVETLNSMIPLWQRSKKDVTEEEYNQFYKDKFFAYENPLSILHASVEGNVSYQSLLFIPEKAPYDFYTKEHQRGLQLYSSGVMIMEHCEDLIPEHFRFVKGVVDSQDLSLNISRELLQHNRQLKLIAANLEKKVRAELEKLCDTDRENYEKFFTAFGLQLKYGVVAEYGRNKETLQDLLLFFSEKEQKLVTLKQYTERMLTDQKYIYFAAGESRARLAELPQAELLRERGYDILYFTDEVDEFVAQTLRTYADKELRSIVLNDLGLLTDEEKKAAEQQAEEQKDVLEFVQNALGDKVKEVRLSGTLRSHPVCLAPDASMSFEMERYLKRVNPEFAFETGRILELNADHPSFLALRTAMAEDEEKASMLSKLLYAQALLIAGLPLEDPTAYTDMVCSLM